MKTIEMQPVRSSNIASIGYDPEAQALHVLFSSGGKYEYSGVSPEEHAALLDAKSVGSHLHTHIKGRYPARKIG